MRVMQLGDMGKRKRDAFTTLESVPDWLESSEETPRPFEGEDDPASLYVADGQSKEAVNWNQIYVADGQSKEAVDGNQIYVADKEANTIANWDQTYVAEEKPRGTADWNHSYAATSSGDLQANEGSGADTEVTGTSREGQSQPTLAAAAVEWLEAAKTPVTGEGSQPELALAEESNIREHQALNAFWALLRQAGYETWGDD